MKFPVPIGLPLQLKLMILIINQSSHNPLVVLQVFFFKKQNQKNIPYIWS